jgi:putative DNA primase/helicase
MSRPDIILSHGEIIDQFRRAMADAGVPYSGTIEADSDKIQRFTVDGDRKGAMTGWLTLHTDGLPAGMFGCWKRLGAGNSVTWCAKSEGRLTDDERRQLDERRRETQARRKADEAERHHQAAEQAVVVWEAASECVNHPYLQRKGVKSHSLRIGRWTRVDDETGKVWLDIPDALLIPVRDGKKLVSLQAIFADNNNAIYRDKDFLPGGKKRGCFFSIGKPVGDNPVIVVCEGYATGATIHEATDHTVAVAFDAGNLQPVAERIRAAFPSATIVIAADNDRWTTTPIENPGVHYAKQAANAETRAYVAIPEFNDLSSKPTDFNDLAHIEGTDAVRDQLEAAAKLKPVTTQDASTAVAFHPTMANVDWRAPLPEIGGKGKPISTIENFAEIMNRLGVTIRYNVISKECEILIPGEGFSIDNQANASIAWIISWCGRFGMPIGQVGDFITYLADKNPYNPVATWIQSKPWDGNNRLLQFFDTVKSVGESSNESVRKNKIAMMRRWMISAVAAAFSPAGVSAHGVLVFQGDQYLGKTKWFKQLVPAQLGVIAEGLMLKPDDKDSVKQAVSHWLVELGELDATFRKSDIAQLKSFLTRDKDVIRRAYARLESSYARRTVFFASVNPKEFLHDPTGNRRYWTIECEHINHDHGIDMQQVWAQVHMLYVSGQSWFLTPEEMQTLNDANKSFEVIDPIAERIKSGLDWDESVTLWTWKTATDILIEVGIDRPTQSEATRAANIVRSMNGNQGTRKGNHRVLLVPSKVYGK